MKYLLIVFLLLVPVTAMAQGPTQNVAYRFRRLIADPATCNPGDVYFNTVTAEYRKCATANTWSDFGSGGGGGANTALSNLAAVAINTDLIFAANTSGIEFGTSTQNILTYVNGTGPRFADGNTGNLLTFNVQSLLVDRTVTWPNANTSIPIAAQTLTFTGPTAARTYTFPDANATLIHGALGATDNAIPRANGTGGSTLQASGVTIDDSDNISTTGSISSGVGGSVAGTIELGEGSAPSLVADTISEYAPADVAAGGIAIVKLGAAATGVRFLTNSAGVMTESVVATSGTGNIIRQTAIPYDVAVMYDGVPGVSAVFRFVAARDFDSGSSWAGTVCSAAVAATAQTDFVVAVNGVTKATLRFAAAATTCTIVSGTTTAIVAGDVITITAPVTPDATLASVAITLLGTLH